jgi:hypothetical protein
MQSKQKSTVRVTFGSHLSLNQENPRVFDSISDYNPDVFIWLGEILNVAIPEQSDDELADYDWDYILKEFKEKPSIARLARTSYVTGVIDVKNYDHLKSVYFNFLGEDYASPRRQRDGLHQSILIGSEDFGTVKILLIDITKDMPTLDHLGEDIDRDQWKWLSDELKKKDADFNIIAAAYQLLPNDKLYDDALSIKYKVKLVDLIRKTNASVLLLSTSGYQGFGEILTFPCPEDIGYDLLEMSSAGLNSYDMAELPVINRLIVPETFNNYSDRIFEPNFGRIEINWNTIKNKTSISLELANQKGELLLNKTTTLKDYIVKNRTGLNERICTNNLYGSADAYKNILRNLLWRLTEPEMLPILIALITTGCLALVFCSACACWASSVRQRLTQQPLNEYEHFHRD